MNKRFAISVIFMMVMMMGLGFLVHGVLLGNDYGRLTGLYRTPAEQQRYLPSMMLGHLFTSIAFVWLYSRSKDSTPFLVQGIRFGLAIAAVAVVPKFLIYYAVQPIPDVLVVKQILFDTVGLILMGIVVAKINE